MADRSGQVNDSPDVLIVGAGPVGLTASLLLHELGVSHRIIDRREGPHRAPQAHVVNARTLEIYRMLGVDIERLKSLATPVEDGSWVRWTTTLSGEELGVLEYEKQGDAQLSVTPTPLLNLSQHLLEPVLLDTAKERGISVEYGRQWDSMVESPESVASTVSATGGGGEETINAKYVLAADGAGSRVRKQLGIAMEGPDELENFMMVHFEAALRGVVGDRPAILYWCMDPQNHGTLIAHNIDHTWVYMQGVSREDANDDPTTDDYWLERIRGVVGAGDVDINIKQRGVWRMSSQLAERYHSGRVFLIGDSAHRFPPAGGMGLNSGVSDAHNLVWKLTGVLRGEMPDSIFDTYGNERRPVAAHNAEQSLTNALKMLEVPLALGITGAPGETLDLDDAKREAVKAAIDNQIDHFQMLNLQLGYAYDGPAITPDGTDPAPIDNPVQDFVPQARPGHRLPHAWLGDPSDDHSLLDEVPYDRFTLIAGSKAEELAQSAAAQAGVGARVVGSDLQSSEDLEQLLGIVATGAILIRPDQHVCWRASANAQVEHVLAALESARSGA